MHSIFLAALAVVFACSSVRAQHPVIQQALNDMHIDSMMRYVNELSGELPVDIGNGPEPIISRHKYQVGNEMAAQYIVQKLQSWGYEAVVQQWSTTGANILATKPGVVYPDDRVILCAHYDALPGGPVAAPAADDNASGTAAALEAARILRDVDFEYTVVFAFWDEEEQGLVGSGIYAGIEASNDRPIHAVVNMDAIAWDGNGDTKARVHTRPIANSIAIADTCMSVLSTYGIDIDLIYTQPGAGYSDHASFWNEGYGAILIIEEFGADPNPYYHTSNDRSIHFDVPYYEKLARLSIGTMMAMAVPVSLGAAVAEAKPADEIRVMVLPNPVAHDAVLRVQLEAPAALQIVLRDAAGRVHGIEAETVWPAGRHAVPLHMAGLAPGPYFVQLQGLPQGNLAIRVLKTP